MKGQSKPPLATTAIVAQLRPICQRDLLKNMPKEIYINPLLPFTCDDLLYILTVEQKESLRGCSSNHEGKMHRRGDAECTLSSHSTTAPSERKGIAVDIREQKAFELADRGRVVKRPNGWHVYSLTSTEKYHVTMMPLSCSCSDWELRHRACKHILAVQITQVRELSGTAVKQDSVKQDIKTPPLSWPKKTYSQDWPNYDLAQQNERSEFRRLLADLCSTLPQRPSQKGTKGGNSFAALSDVIFAAVYKIYSGMSGRRFTTELRETQDMGFVSQAVHHSTIARCLEDPATTPILHSLIEASSLPFRAIEIEFAVDSSGFSACKFDRWYDEKWGRQCSEHSWVKVHAIVGTTTHVVASVIIDGKDSPDAPQFPPLVKAAAKNFTVNQVSGDKAYASLENFQAVADCGGTGYLAFKSNATGGIGGVYERMYHLFCLNKDEYLAHYHRRSNIESLFSAVKRLFGDSVRSKSEVAMKNEALGKLLAYNVTLLVHAIYELGLNPRFGNDQDDTPSVLPMVRPG
jgi:transposase